MLKSILIFKERNKTAKLSETLWKDALKKKNQNVQLEN